MPDLFVERCTYTGSAAGLPDIKFDIEEVHGWFRGEDEVFNIKSIEGDDGLPCFKQAFVESLSVYGDFETKRLTLGRAYVAILRGIGLKPKPQTTKRTVSDEETVQIRFEFCSKIINI